ncbi:hypothetical protein HYT02_01005 [Candidatus Gottesmanbacteria bacterium]|nr:hypothetical protein [Candidatus Gottesmanbacteria bacterium]
MAINSELHRPIHTRKVSAFFQSEIQGIPVPNNNTGLNPEDLKELFVVRVSSQGDQDNSVELIQISPDHHRSYEVRFTKTGTIFWNDEYGNIFSSFSIKGNNLSFPLIAKSTTSDSGYAVYGMQESDSMVRILRASQMLRFHHVDTEMIIGVIEPTELPINDELLPIVEFKKTLIKNLFTRIKDNANRNDELQELEIKPEEIGKINLHLENQVFLFTLRGMQAPERVSDLKYCTSREDLKLILEKSFEYVNEVERYKAENEPLYKPRFFSAEDDQSIEDYFIDYLPKKTASNFATLHNLGLSHGYSHAGNVSLVGSLYDLDSVMGKAVDENDGENQVGRMNGDIFYFLYGHDFFNDSTATDIWSMGIRDTFETLEKNGVLNKKQDVPHSSRFYEFSQVFLRQYIKQRGWEEDIIQHLPLISNLFVNFNYPNNEVYKDALEYYMNLVLNQTGWKFGSDEDHLRQAEKFVQHTTQEGLENLDKVISRNPDDKNFDSIMKKHKKLHLRRSANQKRSDKLEEVIKVDIKEERNDQLEELTAQFGKEAVETIVEMEAVRQHQIVGEIVNNAYFDRKSINILKRKIIEKIGWETDLLAHIKEICERFDAFQGPTDESHLDYYFDKLIQQLGWTYVHPESSQELIEKFIEFDQQKLNTSEDQRYEQPDPIERLYMFVADRVGNTVSQQFERELAIIESQYGEDNTRFTALFFALKSLNELSKYMTGEEITKFKERINQTIG